ncbi:rod shape-determining protein MreD [Cognatiyoonia sp. IB215446]|uniref:rod shape-determining protein MreD n=1 Tax=Cognatiyoonia sp. IB215446 TaxID=3097355 RepID=UPI002A12A242|nr:rod shape-determining protein MreD [Cognatiyoonia sp. IB215446]MDX8350204.1 rod shape-determining protein MreD [Cognatiyoonia sp. IB215446]
MAERTDARTWTHRAVFLMLAFVIIVAQLVPLDMRPTAWAAPDLLLVITLVWVARKPRYLPVLVIAFVFLAADFLFQRPPGLWAALVVMLTETIRRQHREFRQMPLFVEWGTITFGVVAITVLNRLALAITMVPQAPLGLTLIQMIGTILIYPLVVLIAHFIFGVSRAAPGEVGSRGQRI